MAKKYAWESAPLAEETTPQSKRFAWESAPLAEEPKAEDFVTSPMGGAELAARLPREAIRTSVGAILPTEAVFGATTALGGVVEELIKRGEFQSAHDTIAQAKKLYEQDIERQKQVRVQYPKTSLGAETVGLIGTLPLAAGGAAAEGVTAAAPKLSQIVAEGAKTGAAIGALGKASEIATEAPYKPMPLGQAVKETALAAPVGALVGAALPPALAGVTAGLNYGEALVKKIGLSDTAKKAIQTVLGPPVKLQEKFLAGEQEIEALPTLDLITGVLGDIKNEVRTIDKTNKDSVAVTKANLTDIIQGFKEAKDQARGDLKSQLGDAVSELGKIQEKLKGTKVEVKEELGVRKKEIKELGKPQDISPWRSEVDTAVVDLMDQISKDSAAAREMIDPEYRMKRSDIEKAVVKQIGDLGVPGTAKPGEETVALLQKKTARDQLRVLLNDVRKLPEELNGQQIKNIIQTVDKSMNPKEWDPTIWNSDLGSAFKNIRFTMDSDLKLANEDYEAKMVDVVSGMDFLNKFKDSFSKRDPMVQVKKAARDTQLRELLQEMSQRTGRDLMTPLKVVETGEFYKQPLIQEQLLKSDPAYAQLKQLETMIDLTESQDFNRAVFKSVKDTEQGKRIIELKEKITNLRNPEFLKSQVQSMIAANQLTVEQGQNIVAEAQRINDNFKKIAQRITANPKAEQDILSILRAPKNDVEGVGASRFIEALTQLPEKEFNQYFSELGLNTPKDVARMFDLLRVKQAMDMPRTQGSRRVLSGSVVGKAVGEVMGLQKPSVMAAIFSQVGMFADEFGGKMTQVYLRNLNRMEGLPSYDKLINASPIPMSQRGQKAIATYIGTVTKDIRDSDLFPVAEDRVADIANDINGSSMSSLAKAKAMNQLNKLKALDGASAKKLLQQGLPQSQVSPLPAYLAPKPTPTPDLEEDRADTQKEEESGYERMLREMLQSQESEEE